MALSALLSSHWDPAFVMAECECDPCACKPSAQPQNQAAIAPVDVRETENSYEFEVDVPGMNKDQVKVKLEQQGRVLSLSGERELHQTKVPGHKYHRVERSRGRFERKFRLPKDANGEEIKAAVKGGVLTVTLAKKKAVEPKVISIEVQDN